MEKNNQGIRIIFAILLPFSALLYSIKNFRSANGKWFFVFGLSFLGFTINAEGDLERYRDSFYEMKNISWTTLFEDILSFQQGDFYINMIAKITGAFSQTHNIYMAILISIYAYFFYSVIEIFIGFLPKKLNGFLIQLVIAFVLFFSIRNFIAVRFYTASLIFIYGIMKYIISNNNKKYLIFAILAPVIHISFLICLPFIVIFVFIKNSYKTAFILMISCYFIGQSSAVDFLNKTSENNSENVINSKIKNYASEQGLETLNERYTSSAEQANFKLSTLDNLKTISDNIIALGILLILYYRKTIIKDEIITRIFTLVFVFWAIANLMLKVSNGFRFTILYLFLSLGLFLLLQIKNYLNRSLIIYLKFSMVFIISYGFVAIVAANVLFKTNYFISNYFVEFFVFQNITP